MPGHAGFLVSTVVFRVPRAAEDKKKLRPVPGHGVGGAATLLGMKATGRTWAPNLGTDTPSG